MKAASLIGALGAISGFLGVAAGAFGAHGLRGSLSPERLQVFETGARYQLIHAVAIVVVAVALERADSRALMAAGWLFVVGTVIFAGSLYALSLSGVRVWGAVTPIGGLCFLAGWLLLAAGLARR
ncbi:MAG: DUF423 domain-containing protein [Bacteroidota bacterium]